MSEFVVDDLGTVHLRESFDRIRARLSPSWQRVLGLGRPLDMHQALDYLIGDAHRASHERSLARWADDGGREP